MQAQRKQQQQQLKQQQQRQQKRALSASIAFTQTNKKKRKEDSIKASSEAWKEINRINNNLYTAINKASKKDKYVLKKYKKIILTKKRRYN